MNAFVYYGISTNTENLAGDPYLNGVYAALVEFVGVAICHFSITYLGRKVPYSIFMALTGLSLIPIPFISEYIA